jgi:hypothetical protein
LCACAHGPRRIFSTTPGGTTADNGDGTRRGVCVCVCARALGFSVESGSIRPCAVAGTRQHTHTHTHNAKTHDVSSPVAQMPLLLLLLQFPVLRPLSPKV